MMPTRLALAAGITHDAPAKKLFIARLRASRTFGGEAPLETAEFPL